jgi:hypothetical protein
MITKIYHGPWHLAEYPGLPGYEAFGCFARCRRGANGLKGGLRGWDKLDQLASLQLIFAVTHKPKDECQACVVDRKQFCSTQDQLNQLSKNDTQESA